MEIFQVAFMLWKVGVNLDLTKSKLRFTIYCYQIRIEINNVIKISLRLLSLMGKFLRFNPVWNLFT